ncbi:MAG TPA: protein kinase [Baekduia sp.]|nr:protein kinase [Baekduia sp.]
MLGEIGRGGFCVVHAAQLVTSDGSEGPVVAVKSLIHAAGATPETVARFQREARLLDDLTHPNIVPVVGRNLSNANPYFFMEKADGKIAQGRWQDEDWAVDVYRQNLAAMSYAHDKGVE